MNNLILLLLSMLIVTSFSGLGAASEILVKQGESIQNSINIASPGDTIIIEPGTYIENIIIIKDNLTIRSDSGYPDDTIIKARNKTDNVFFIQADKVRIEGFNIGGSIRYGWAGICLSACSECAIENNKLSNNSFGIYLFNSKVNKISRNDIYENYRGIYVNTSENNTLSGNNVANNREYGIASQDSIGNLYSGNIVFNNERGIYFGRSDGNTLMGNIVRNNNVYGIFICGASDRNTIYNNYFNDTNMTIKNGTGNAYNISKRAGTNIVGGPYIGGNYWAKPDGTGFSQTAVDKDGDGISDSVYAYLAGSKYTDFLPLVNSTKTPEMELPLANFSEYPKSGYAPLNVTFNDLSTGSPTSWNWNFGDGTNSTVQNPTHTYSTTGAFTINLTVSNDNGTDSKTGQIIVSDPPAPVLPIANFSCNVTSGYAPLSVQFYNNSSNATSLNWNFGDGTSSAQLNPVHTYSAAGNYTFTLTVYNINGTDSKTGSISVVKEVTNSSLLVKYRNRLRESTPEDVLSNYSYIDVGGLSGVGKYRDVICFDLNGFNNATQINNASLSLTWYYPGSARLNDTVIEIYRPALMWNSVYTSWNKRDNNITWSSPGGDWYDKNGILDGSTPYFTLTLKATSLPNNSYSNFDVTDLVREYTTGKYSNTGFFIKARTESDNYVAFYSSNCKLSLLTSILPVANFSSNVTGGYVPLSVQFTDFSENATVWTWDFGDGSNSTQQSPMHIYSVAGNYTVNLMVSNENGTSSKLATIVVQKSIPKISWSKPADILYGTKLSSTQLNAAATVPGTFVYTPTAGSVLSAGTQTLHVDFVPDDTANYTTASNDVKINILEKPIYPSANFSTNVTTGTAPLTVKFTDLSKNATSRIWKFGDGSNSTEPSPLHTYLVAGNYTATLTASNSNGTDSMTGNIRVVKKETVTNLSNKYNNRLREASPESVYSNSSFIDVGALSGVRYRDAIWFDLGEYASDTQIINATLSLYWYYPNSSRLKDTVVEIYRPASSLNSSYVSWNKRNKGVAWSNPGGDWYDKNGELQGSTPYASITLKASSLPRNNYCEFNITNIVKEYISGKYSNTGFLVKARNESDNYIAFYSAQIGNVGEVPKLKLVYS